MSSFVIVGNVQRFDIVSHFENNSIAFWKQVSRCSVGDEAYIYIGKPYGALMFKCLITEVDLSEQEIDPLFVRAQKRHSPYMKIKLVQKLQNDKLKLHDLQENGLKTVQCATKMSEELRQYIEEVIG